MPTPKRKKFEIHQRKKRREQRKKFFDRQLKVKEKIIELEKRFRSYTEAKNPLSEKAVNEIKDELTTVKLEMQHFFC